MNAFTFCGSFFPGADSTPDAVSTPKGLAAAMALDGKQAISDICVPTLQQQMAASKVMIHFDDALIPQPGTDSSVADNNGHI
jgi:hypothetical protein